jgi:hypothetical protein
MGGRLLNEARVMIRDKTLDRALDRLRKPEPRLVPTYTCDTVSGRSFYIEPDGARIAKQVRCST